MTGLLVSVRSAGEAAAALAGGAAVIDIKEPDRGALGAAEPATWRAVREVVASQAPVSIALGELFAAGSASETVTSLAEQTGGMTFAKIGLAGAARRCDWQRHWRTALAALAPQVSPVAVAYADWQTAAAPRPESVIETGADLGCAMLLLDTFDKARGHLLDHLPRESLSDLCRRAGQRGLPVVLAGSLKKVHLPDVLPLAPALIAIRGAVCFPDRRGAVKVELVRAMADLLTNSPLAGAAQLPQRQGA